MTKNKNIGDIVQDDERVWVSVDQGVELKVMHVCKASGVVVVLTRMVADTRMPTHHHHCSTYNFTVSGEWEYAEGAVARVGSHAFEPTGVTHTPMTVSNDMLLFSVFTAEPGETRLFTYNPDSDEAFDIDIETFVELEKLCLETAS